MNRPPVNPLDGWGGWPYLGAMLFPVMSRDELRQAGLRLFDPLKWQTRMAQALGVDTRTVRSWLSGRSRIPNPVAVAIRLMEQERRRAVIVARCISSDKR